jgi:hypothetical protein
MRLRNRIKAANALRGFLTESSKASEIFKAVRIFISKIIKLQKRWRAALNINAARIDIAIMQWDALQPKRLAMMEKRQKKEELAAKQASKKDLLLGVVAEEGGSKEQGGAKEEQGTAKKNTVGKTAGVAQKVDKVKTALTSPKKEGGEGESPPASPSGDTTPKPRPNRRGSVMPGEGSPSRRSVIAESFIPLITDEMKRSVLKPWLKERMRAHSDQAFTYYVKADALRIELRERAAKLHSFDAAKQLLSGVTPTFEDKKKEEADLKKDLLARLGPPPVRSFKLPARELGKLIDEQLMEARKNAGLATAGSERAKVRLSADTMRVADAEGA